MNDTQALMRADDLLAWAREEWAFSYLEPGCNSDPVFHGPERCPPEVVAALLAVAEHAQIMGIEIAASGSLSRNTMEGIVLHDGLGDLLADLDAAIAAAKEGR